MDGMTMNSTCMYDEVAEIRNLNKVEGFDPRRYMRLIQKEGQAGKYYLDVAYRKLWFRLRYPEGEDRQEDPEADGAGGHRGGEGVLKPQ